MLKEYIITVDAITILKNLPQHIRSKIDETYGSWEQLYERVYVSSANDYFLLRMKPAGYEKMRNDVQNELYNIKQKLDEFGLDGHSLVTDVSRAFTETIVTRTITDLDTYLAQFATSFDFMKAAVNKYLNL
jgi:hypothetical protein